MRIVSCLTGALLGGVALGHPDIRSRLALRSEVDDCTENSLAPSRWWIDNFKFIIYDWDYGGTNGTFGFTSYYSGTNTTVECMAKDVDLAKLETTWAKCDNNQTEFQFSLTDISMTIKETWSCPGAPGNVFTASSSGLLMLHGCLDNPDTPRGVESDCNLMETEMAANATQSGHV